MNKKIFFCANAHFDAGIGDIKTCITIAKDLKYRKGLEVAFLMENHELGIEMVKKNNIKTLAIEKTFDRENKVQKVLEILKTEVPDFIVFEAYPNDLELIKRVRDSGFRTLCVDFDEKRSICADVIVNWDWKRSIDDYQKCESVKDQIFLMGAKYAVLDDEYKKFFSRSIPAEPQKILITTGGTDISNLSIKFLRFLEYFETKLDIDLIIGPGVSNKESIKEASAGSSHHVACHEDVESLFPYLVEADIVITTAGLTSYEVIATRVPSLMVSALEHQRPKPEFLSSKNAVIDLGLHEELTQEVFMKEFNRLYYDRKLRETISRNCRDLVDCRGAERISDCIEELING